MLRNTADTPHLDAQPSSEQVARTSRNGPGSGLNRWLQIFLTIIAGTVVAIIAWTVLERFLHIIILLIASFLLAYLLGPIVDRIEQIRLPRIAGILLVYLVVIGVIALGVALLVGPLTVQLQDLLKTLPTLVETKAGAPSGIDRFFQQQGIPLDVAGLRTRLAEYVSSAGTSLLGSTLAIVAGLATLVTDLFLILAMTFYLLLDGRAMHNRALRLLPAAGRERWFFVEATLNKVLGGYIRGQIIVALTVGVAAGVGSALLGVQYSLVIGVLAFLFEFIPLLGPVLGMVPAVIIAFFQSPTLALWTIVYFIILQQVESNVIVPRISGHAVGLHPLGALLALLAGVELGGLGGALLAVPAAGVLYVLAMALYSDATSQTELLMDRPRRTAYGSLRNAIRGRRTQMGTLIPAQQAVAAGTTSGSAGSTLVTNGAGGPVSADGATAPTVSRTGPAQVPHDRLATIAQQQAELIAQFEVDEKEQASIEQAAARTPGEEAEKEVLEGGPDEVRASDVP